MYFGFMRFLSGMHSLLDIASFYQNSRTNLLTAISQLCKETDRSHNKIECIKFF